MKLSGVVFLLLAAFAGASLNDNGIEGGARVVLVAPVLEPPKDSGTHVTTRSRQFPILVLLSQQNPGQPKAKALPVNPEPVYVQKLEDQEDLRPYRKIREKRTLKSKGGRGGMTVVVVPVSGGGGRGQYGGGRRQCGGGRGQSGWGQYSGANAASTAGSYGNQGGYGGYPQGGSYGGSNPHGGNYGGGGGGNSYASASANAYASGKR